MSFNDVIVPQIRKQGRIRFDFLGGCILGGVEPTDIDSMLERHGHFLGFEFKQPGEELPKGQEIALRGWLNPRSVSLLQVEGIPPTEVHRHRWLSSRRNWSPGEWQVSDAYLVRELAREWWAWADEH